MSNVVQPPPPDDFDASSRRAGNGQPSADRGAAQSPTHDATTRPILMLAAVLVIGIAAGLLVQWQEPAVAVSEFVTDMPPGGDDIGMDEEGDMPVAVRAAGPGALALRGVVVDTAGLPISGVQVFAELEPPPTVAGDSKPPGVFTSWRAVASPSDGNGTFHLDGLMAAHYRLVVRGNSIATAEVRQVPVPKTGDDELRIVASRRIVVAGKVVDGRNPVRHARVAIRSDAIGGVMEMVTDSAGQFAFRDLPEGGYQVWAWQGDLASAPQRVLRKGNLPSGEVVLILGTATVVVGRVVDRDDGIGVAAVVELTSADDREAPRYAQSASDGVFRMEGIPAGRWIADAYAPGYLTTQRVELQAGRGVPEIVVASGAIVEGRVVDEQGRPVRGAVVSASVATKDGRKEVSQLAEAQRLRRFDGAMISGSQPRAGSISQPAASSGLSKAATFEARGELGILRPVPAIPMSPTMSPTMPLVSDAQTVGVPSQPPSNAALIASPVRATVAFAQSLYVDPRKSSQWTTATDGTYRIRAVPGGEVSIRVQASSYPTISARVGIAVDSEVLVASDIVLSAGVLISGRVIDQDRVPVAGATVTASTSDGNGVSRAFTDAAGRYQLGPLLGPQVVLVEKAGLASVTEKVNVESATTAGAAPLQLDIVMQSSNGRIDGIVEDDRGVPMRAAILTVAGSNQRATAAADGTFSLDKLAPGRISLTVTHPRYPAFTSSAQTGQRLRLRVPIGGGITGVVIDDATSTVLAGIRVTATGPNGAKASAATSAKGQFSLSPLAAGKWQLTVHQLPFSKVTRQFTVAAADEPGQPTIRDVRIDLRRGTTVAGVVRDGRGQRVAAALVVISSDDSECRGVAGPYGEYSLTNCPAGELTLTASKGDESGSRTLSARAGADVREIAVEIR